MRRMNRTQKNMALGAAGLLALFLLSGRAKGAATEKAALLCSPPPLEIRPTPIAPKARPCQPEMLGDEFVAPTPEFSGKNGDDKIFTRWAKASEDPDLDLIFEDAGIAPFDEPLVVVYWPSGIDASVRDTMELIIQDWAWVYGYRLTVFAEGYAADRGFTAETWVDGKRTGEFAMPDAYGARYQDELKARGLEVEGFTQGLIQWLYGK